ncbi:unnamed protein product [Toxocara canis]|uniref:tRNA (guanine-N(7)-)-methyltransferase non-catalytic subunit n=1 Tax=Toxocara canis TaxID=6265 RepID=A0A183UEY1_TOXCA|nr:unnamed protein product [Toxocara canis]
MARVHCSNELIVVTAKTAVTIFSFEVNDAELKLKQQKVLDVDIAVDEIPKLSDGAKTSEDGKKNGCGESSCKAANNDHDDRRKAKNENRPREIGKQLLNARKHSAQILASGFSEDGLLFAVVTSMKTCLVYDTQHDWKLHRRAFRFPKAPAAITFDRDKSHVIVADRSGNICRYKLDECANSITNVHVDINGEESCYEGEPLLGHMSMVLDVALSDDGRFVLSGDRDEKLRISRYPQSFIIHRFCLGHTSYVSSVCVVAQFAFTSGGDGTIRAWNIEEGTTVAVLDRFAKKPICCMRKYHSAKVDPQEMIKLAIVLDGSAIVSIVTFDARNSLFDVMCELNAPSNMVDVAFCDPHHVVAVTNSSILFGEIKADGRLRVVDGIDDSLVTNLREANNGLPCLEKRIGFDNVGEYQQRKNERIRNRKRKAHDSE